MILCMTEPHNKESQIGDIVQLQGVAARSLLKREKSEGKWEGETMLQLVSTALSGCQGSPYLTAHVYGPTIKVILKD